MFSDEEKKKLLGDISEIRAEQSEQNERLDHIEQILKGDPDYPNEPGMRQKVGEMYEILRGWRAVRKFVLGIIFLVGAIFGSTVWDIITRILGGSPGGTP